MIAVDEAASTLVFNDESATPYGYPSADASTYFASESIGDIVLTVTDQYGVTAPLTIKVLPQTPQDFIASGATASNQSIQLFWQHSRPGITGFELERALDSGPFEALTTDPPLGSGVRTYTDSGLQPTTLYRYRIYAVSGTERSPASPEAYALPK